MTISAVVLTNNNQDTIDRCLKSVDFCDEVIVVDDSSTDTTIVKARKYATKILKSPLNNNWAAQRNFALKKAASDWILFLDSDEVISLALKKEILNAIGKDKYQGYFLHRQDLFLGQSLKYGETANVKLLRLARHGAGTWKRPVHEIWQIEGSTGQLKNPILHQRDLSLNELFLHFECRQPQADVLAVYRLVPVLEQLDAHHFAYDVRVEVIYFEVLYFVLDFGAYFFRDMPAYACFLEQRLDYVAPVE